ncbi:unnamed protein product [Parajaminaea phylloscopi]
MRSSVALVALVGALATTLSFTPASASLEPHAHRSLNHPGMTAARRSRALEKRSFSGQATFYNTETGNAGSCGNYLKNSGFTVALNAVQYQQSWCHRQITISANGKTAQATIEDECPGDGVTCKYGALDLSPSLFSFFGDKSLGVMDITWWFSDGSGGGGSSGSSGSSKPSHKSSNSNKNNNNSSNDDDDDSNNDDDDDDDQDNAAAEAAASRSSASAYAASTASVASASRAAAASRTRAAVAASRSSVSASHSRSRASAHRASVSSERASSSAAVASASAEAARPKNFENLDAVMEGLQKLAMVAHN